MKKIAFLCLILFAFFACNEAPENKSATSPTEVTDEPTDSGGSQDDPDLEAVTKVLHDFYKWYEAFIDDNKRNIEYVDSKGKTSKLDKTKLAAYHAELMKSGFLNKAYVDNDVAYLKEYEAEWQKNNENGNEGPLSGLDFDRVYCGQDWDILAYTTGAVKVDGLGTNQVKATIESSRISLVKENGKWLIAKIICE